MANEVKLKDNVTFKVGNRGNGYTLLNVWVDGICEAEFELPDEAIEFPEPQIEVGDVMLMKGVGYVTVEALGVGNGKVQVSRWVNNEDLEGFE